MIDVKSVSKVFNAGKTNEFIAVEDVSLNIDQLQITVLKGPSGSGKTTLLSMLGCMARPTSGRILLDGLEITSLPERFLTQVRRAKFGFVFQQFNLVKGLTALDNVILPAYPLGDDYGKLKSRAMHILEKFKIAQKAFSKVEWLSGGEAQRVCIARALMNSPKVIIADEPTAHLDSRLSKEFMAIMESLHAQGMTILIASHDAIVHESVIVDRTIEMRDGRLVADSTRQ
jgi:putative ABC transport system ATP-binding protein